MSEGMSIARELMQDHEELEALIIRANAMPAGFERQEIVRRACTRYLQHAAAEERVLFPAMRDNLADGLEMADLLGRTQEGAERLVEHLALAGEQDGAYEATFAAFAEAYVQHVALLDSHVLPALSNACLPEDMNHLGRKLRAAEKDAVVERLAARPGQ